MRIVSAVLIVLVALAPISLAAQEQTPQQRDAQRLRAEAKSYQLSGYATMAGGLVFQILGQTALAQKSVYCNEAGRFVSCTEFKDPNLGAVYGGAAMVGVGAVMVIMGAVKNGRAKKLMPSLVLGPHGIGVSKQVTF